MTPPVAEPWPQFAALVAKDGVRLGTLAEHERALALAWVWAGLPRATTLDERAVNDALKAQLAGAARCLDTDHVELRRWLVDAGWLERDGYGRAYRRVEPEALRPAVRDVADALAGLDTTAWAEAERARRAAERARRQAAWAARQESNA